MVEWNISRGYGKRSYNDIINAFGVRGIKKYNGPVFHYTSFENCIKMLKPFSSQENNEAYTYYELFASHFRFMNDTKEFFEGLEQIVEMLEGKAGIQDAQIRSTIESFLNTYKVFDEIPSRAIPPHYIVSFNKGYNNLAQWKYYGKNCGVAIEYDIENCEFSNFTTDDEYTVIPAYEVLYEKGKKEEKLKAILDELESLEKKSPETNKGIHSIDILLKACAAASFMKDAHYAEEEEIRLLFAPNYDDSKSASSQTELCKLMKKVEYRPRGSEYIIPYLKIRVRGKGNKCPIKSLTVGPGHNQKVIYDGLIMFVQSNFTADSTEVKEIYEAGEVSGVEVNGIEIRRSLIPFRG